MDEGSILYWLFVGAIFVFTMIGKGKKKHGQNQSSVSPKQRQMAQRQRQPLQPRDIDDMPSQLAELFGFEKPAKAATVSNGKMSSSTSSREPQATVTTEDSDGFDDYLGFEATGLDERAVTDDGEECLIQSPEREGAHAVAVAQGQINAADNVPKAKTTTSQWRRAIIAQEILKRKF